MGFPKIVLDVTDKDFVNDKGDRVYLLTIILSKLCEAKPVEVSWITKS